MGKEKSQWQKSLPHDGLFPCVPWWGEAAGRGPWRNSSGAVLSVSLRARRVGSCPGWLISLLSRVRPSMDYSPPGSSVHGILQARILEWVAMPSSRGSSQSGIEHWAPALQADFLCLSHQGSNLIARVSSCSIPLFPFKYHTDKGTGFLSCEDFNEVLNIQHRSSAGTDTQHIFLNLISCFTNY